MTSLQEIYKNVLSKFLRERKRKTSNVNMIDTATYDPTMNDFSNNKFLLYKHFIDNGINYRELSFRIDCNYNKVKESYDNIIEIIKNYLKDQTYSINRSYIDDENPHTSKSNHFIHATIIIVCKNILAIQICYNSSAEYISISTVCKDEFSNLLKPLVLVGKKQTSKYELFIEHNSNTGAIERSTKRIDKDYTYFNRPEFYPYINKELSKYVDDFIASKANILILYGLPGTGKSNFLRFLISYLYQINSIITHVIHDRTLMNDVAIYNHFIERKHTDQVLVFEDCDTLLSPRAEGNQIVSSILNISQGIEYIEHSKKFIFTMNNTDLGTLDQALLRKGRCYDQLFFRKLKNEEITKVQEAFNLPVTYVQGTDLEMQLADILNPEENNISDNKTIKHKVGFY